MIEENQEDDLNSEPYQTEYAEENIKDLYDQFKKIRHNYLPIQNIPRKPISSATPRRNATSFSSQMFHVGQGLRSIPVGQSMVLAQKEVPAHHGGMLTGFTQYFASCEAEIVDSITWSLRINGLPLNDFTDFTGEFSKPWLPCHLDFPLVGGAQTLGTSSLSPGGTPVSDQPTVTFTATNNYYKPVILSARLIGYTFPITEYNDEFQNP